MQQRHYLVSAAFLIQLLRKPTKPHSFEDSIPADGRIVAVAMDQPGYIRVTVESEEYRPVDKIPYRFPRIA